MSKKTQLRYCLFQGPFHSWYPVTSEGFLRTFLQVCCCDFMEGSASCWDPPHLLAPWLKNRSSGKLAQT
jgi:hypothetical protein